MLSIITKVKLNGLDADDQIQFKLRSENLDPSLLYIRKNNDCSIKIEDTQSNMIDQDTGEVRTDFRKFVFTSTSISISITMLETEAVATITVGTDDKDVLVKIAEMGLIGANVELSFK